MDALKAQLQKAESIKQFLKERKEYIKTQLEKFGLVKNLKKLNKTVFYYQQQIAEYKNILNDPKKIEKKALDLLSKTKLWKDFFKRTHCWPISSGYLLTMIIIQLSHLQVYLAFRPGYK
jgi:histone deacetylase complex regulatory component SIN3